MSELNNSKKYVTPELSLLSEEQDKTLALLEKLQHKLAPVLLDPNCEDGDTKGPVAASALCSLRGDIRSAAERQETLNSNISQLINSVDL